MNRKPQPENSAVLNIPKPGKAARSALAVMITAAAVAFAITAFDLAVTWLVSFCLS